MLANLLISIGCLSTGFHARSFVNNFIAGVVSAVFVLLLQRCYRLYRNSKTFSPMEGDYSECVMPTGTPTGGTVKIKATGTTLSTEALNETGHVEWYGTINMNSLNPNVGDGTYHYRGRYDCGVHHIQRDPETHDFLVLGSNTSLPDGKKEWNMLWRRQRPTQ
jgi:hypothetical protein